MWFGRISGAGTYEYTGLKLRFGVRYFNLDGIATITHQMYASHLGIAIYRIDIHLRNSPGSGGIGGGNDE